MSAAKLKLVQKLKLKKYREESGLFLAEGLRLCEMALSAQIDFGFYTPEFLKSVRALNLVDRIKSVAQLYEIPAATFEKISETETPQGILLAVRQRLSAPEKVLEKSLVIVLDAVKDAGNVGTILRTAEAFDCGVVLLAGSVDVFNSKVVRSSMGAIFDLALARLSRLEFLELAKSSGVEILAAAVDSTAEIYYRHSFNGKIAVVFGSEAQGISSEILGTAKKIYIPMVGRAESLNVATATAIVVSEARRQAQSTSL